MKHYTPREAVKLMQKWGFTFSRSSLAHWRVDGRGPDYKKVAGKIFYEHGVLQKFCGVASE